MSHPSIASFDWQESWLHMKLTSYPCMTKHSFDSVFVMDSLCKNQSEAIVFIDFSQWYNNLYFLKEEKNLAPLFRHITYTLRHIWRSLLKATYNSVPFFFVFKFWIGHSVNVLWQRSANYGSRPNSAHWPFFCVLCVKNGF